MHSIRVCGLPQNEMLDPELFKLDRQAATLRLARVSDLQYLIAVPAEGLGVGVGGVHGRVQGLRAQGSGLRVQVLGCIRKSSGLRVHDMYPFLPPRLAPPPHASNHVSFCPSSPILFNPDPDMYRQLAEGTMVEDDGPPFGPTQIVWPQEIDGVVEHGCTLIWLHGMGGSADLSVQVAERCVPLLE